jgi:hypothetical protein
MLKPLKFNGENTTLQVGDRARIIETSAGWLIALTRNDVPIRFGKDDKFGYFESEGSIKSALLLAVTCSGKDTYFKEDEGIDGKYIITSP